MYNCERTKEMKSKYLVLIVAIVALMMAACQGKKEGPAKSNDPFQPQMTVSPYDTATVKQLTNEFLELVKNEQIDEAISRLYVLDGDEVKPLPDAQKPECRFWLSMYKVYDYRITNFTFYKETDSEVNYELIIEDPVMKENPARMNGLIRPVRRDGAWFITLANSKTDKRRSEIDSLRSL